MKQSGRSIQFRSLNRVLGNDFNVQPYQVFVEEEQKKLHEHWLVRHVFLVFGERFDCLPPKNHVYVGCNWQVKISQQLMQFG